VRERERVGGLGDRGGSKCDGQGIRPAILLNDGVRPNQAVDRQFVDRRPNLSVDLHGHQASIIWYRSRGGDALRLGR